MDRGIASLLPPGKTADFQKAQLIYDASQGAKALYAVLHGTVSVALANSAGEQVITRCVGPAGLFGESSLTGRSMPEMAVAVQEARLMCWPPDDVREHMQSDPCVALALIRHLAARSSQLRRRVAGSRLRLSRRLALALLELSSTLGTPGPTGTELRSITHAVLAEYVGAARELVTKELMGFRVLGLIEYSHSRIQIDTAALLQFARTEAPRRSASAVG